MSIPFDLSNTTTRVLTCAGVVAAGTVGAAILPAGVAVAFGSAAAGIAGNLLATDIDQEVRSRLNASDVLRNHDLERLCGEAIRLVIIKATESSEPLLEKHKSRIRKFAEKVPAEWSKIVNSPSWKIELEQADIKAIPNFFLSLDEHESAVRSMKALTPSLWLKTLGAITDIIQANIPAEALKLFADRLHREYPVAVRELLKRDDLGFRALELLFMKTMLDRLGAFSPKNDGLDEKEVMAAISTFANAAENTKAEWSRRHRKWLEQLDDAARNRHEKIIFRINLGFDSVGDSLRKIESILARIECKLDEIKDMQKDVIQNFDKTNVAISQVHALKKEASSLALELRYDEAFDCMAKASEIANAAKNKSLEFECRMLQMSHATVLAERGDRSIAIERLRRIHYALKSLDASSWHHLAVEMWISRIQGRRSEVIRLGEELLVATGLPLEEKVEVLSALALAYGYTGDEKELLNTRESIKQVTDLIREDDPDYAMTLWSNYLSAASRLAIIEERDVVEFIFYTRAACNRHDVSLLRIAQIISATGDDVLQRARSDQALGFARDIHTVGYELVEQNGNAMKTMEFALKIAQIDAERCQIASALEWLAKADKSKSIPCKYDSPDARIAHLFGLERAKSHIFLILAGCDRGPKKLEVLNSALKSAQKAEDLYSKCIGATSGNLDLETDVLDLKKRVIELIRQFQP